MVLVNLAVSGGLAGATGAAAVLVARRPALVRRQLILLMLLALVLRVAAGLLLHAYEGWQITTRGVVTPDEAVIDYAARLLAAGDPRSPQVLGGSLHTAWLLIASTIYQLWSSLLALDLLNALLGTLLLVPVYFLGDRLHSPRAGVLSAAAVAVFPTAIVWSSLGLREPLVALVVTTVLALAVQLSTREAVAAAGVGLAASLFVLGFVRGYMSLLLILVALASAVTAAVAHRHLRPLLATVASCLMGVLLILSAPGGGDVVQSAVSIVSNQTSSAFNPFSDCDAGSCAADSSGPSSGAFREPGITKARAAAALGTQTSSDGDPSLQSVREKGAVRAFAIAILSGRPVWRTEEYYFLLQPGVIVWWTILPLILAGFGSLVSRRGYAETVLMGAFLGGMVVFLALTGQFIRHHFMLEPAGISLAVVGVVSLVSDPRLRFRNAVFGASVLMGLAALGSVVASLGG